MDLLVFQALVFHVIFYGFLVTLGADCIDVITFCPEFSTPKHPFDLWLFLKNFSGGDAFDDLNNSGWTNGWDALDEKMNMILVGANLHKMNVVPFLYSKANILNYLVKSNDFLKY